MRGSLRRVGFACAAWPPGSAPNGVVTYVGHARAGLAAMGVESTVLAGELHGIAESRDVIEVSRWKPSLHWRAVYKAYGRVVGEPPVPWSLGQAIARAARIAHARDPLDLLEIEETKGAAFFVQGAIPRPMVVRLHGPWFLVAPALGFPRDAVFARRLVLEGHTIERADAVSAPSRFVLDSVRRHYGLELPHAQVIPNPVVLPPPEQAWRYEDCERATILFVGRFDRLKGADLVIDAFRQVAEQRTDATLLFVGPTTTMAGPGLAPASLDAYLADKLPPAALARVQVLGTRKASEIAELRRKAFATVVASRYETFPMTAIEALAIGAPLVAADSGGIPEIVEHERNGLLFRSGEAADLAAKLLSLFADPALAASRGAQGARDVAARFATEALAEQTCAFYRRVVERVPRGARPPLRGPLRALTAW